MNDDELKDVMRMAREAGAAADVETGVIYPQCLDAYKFAALIAAAEREACAGICDRYAERDMHPAECAGAIRMRSNY